MFYRENLIPFYGTQTFKLYDNIDDVKVVLDSFITKPNMIPTEF